MLLCKLRPWWNSLVTVWSSPPRILKQLSQGQIEGFLWFLAIFYLQCAPLKLPKPSVSPTGPSSLLFWSFFFPNTLDLIQSLSLPQTAQQTSLRKKTALWFSCHSCGSLVLMVQFKPEIFQYHILSKHSEISFSCPMLGGIMERG